MMRRINISINYNIRTQLAIFKFSAGIPYRIDVMEYYSQSDMIQSFALPPQNVQPQCFTVNALVRRLPRMICASINWATAGVTNQSTECWWQAFSQFRKWELAGVRGHRSMSNLTMYSERSSTQLKQEIIY